MANRVQY